MSENIHILQIEKSHLGPSSHCEEDETNSIGHIAGTEFVRPDGIFQVLRGAEHVYCSGSSVSAPFLLLPLLFLRPFQDGLQFFEDLPLSQYSPLLPVLPPTLATMNSLERGRWSFNPKCPSVFHPLLPPPTTSATPHRCTTLPPPPTVCCSPPTQQNVKRMRKMWMPPCRWCRSWPSWTPMPLCSSWPDMASAHSPHNSPGPTGAWPSAWVLAGHRPPPQGTGWGSASTGTGREDGPGAAERTAGTGRWAGWGTRWATGQSPMGTREGHTWARPVPTTTSAAYFPSQMDLSPLLLTFCSPPLSFVDISPWPELVLNHKMKIFQEKIDFWE